jgi:hypothetical protein
MGPSIASEFGDAKILGFVIAFPHVPHELRNFPAGAVESLPRVIPERGVNGKGEETIGFGGFGPDGELFYFLGGAWTTRPLPAGESDPDSTGKLRRVGLKSLGMGARPNEPEELTNGLDLMAGRRAGPLSA